MDQRGPYPPDITVLMDSRNYEQLITGSGAVWQALNADGTGSGVGGCVMDTNILLSNSYTMVAGIYRRKPPQTRGRSPRERAWFSNDKSIATMVYLLYILPHWSVRHTSSIDTVFDLATTYGNGLFCLGQLD